MSLDSERTHAHRLIIGVGTEYGDDAFGLLVARYLGERHLNDVDIIEHSGEGASLMEAWQGYKHVVIIDSTKSDSEIGATFRFDINAERIPTKFFHYSTHMFSVAEAIETARVLERLPARMIVFGAEGKNYEPGSPVSPILESLIPVVADAALAEFAYH